MKNLFVFCILLFCVGCGGTPDGRYTVERVFFQGYRYTVMTQDPVTKQCKTIDTDCTPTVIADVPEGQPMWMEVKCGKYTIHIRSTSDVNGGRTGGKHPRNINVVD